MSNESLKAPSQIFRWFEKMKANYEKSVLSILDRFEASSEKSQRRIEATNNEYISSLKVMHEKQLLDKNSTISHLQNDINFYRKQLLQQQQITEQLNSRYDAVMSTLLSEKRQDINIRDIFENDEIENLVDPQITPSSDSIKDFNEEYEKGIQLRSLGDTTQAFVLFTDAATQGHIKAMGALARAYFLSEGTDENQCIGLAWLINAADLGHQPAINRSKQIQAQSADLYEEALLLSKTLLSTKACVFQGVVA